MALVLSNIMVVTMRESYVVFRERVGHIYRTQNCHCMRKFDVMHDTQTPFSLALLHEFQFFLDVLVYLH